MRQPTRRHALRAAAALGFTVVYRSPKAFAASMRPLIPFTVTRSGHLLVHAHVGDRRLAAVLDSGASANVVSSAAASALGLRPNTAGTVVGMAGEQVLGQVKMPEIRLATYKVAPSVAYVANLSGLTISDAIEFDLILGQPFFRNSAIDIDFLSERILVWDVDASIPFVGRTSKIATDAAGRLSIPALVDHHPEVPAVHDFGSAIPVYVAPAYAEKVGLMRGKRSSLSATIGMEGVEISQISTLNSLEVGGFLLRDVPFQVPRNWAQNQPLILGLPVLRRFRNLINLSKMTLGLEPIAKGIDLPFSRDRSGIGGQWLGDRMKILFIAPGSPAEKAGLHEGDEIVALDDEPLGPVLFEKRPKPGSEPAGTVERLQLSSGRTAEIVLEDYF